MKNVRITAEMLEEWKDAFAAFQGAFDTPMARLRLQDEFSTDARKRMRHFNDRMMEVKNDTEEQRAVL